MSCIFCEIVAGNIPSAKVYEDDEMLAFKDITPKAPTHILFIPKSHIASLTDLTTEQSALVGRILARMDAVAQAQGLDGYRIVTNRGEQAGQTVFHLHFHLLAGMPMPNMV